MSNLTPELQERFTGLLNSDAILNPADPGHAQAQADAQLISQVQQLTSSAAYWDKNHVDHELVTTRVRRFYEGEFAGVQHGRRPNPMVLDTSQPDMPMRPQLSRGAE